MPVSWGELLDKITILEIKRERIGRPEARRNVETELRVLSEVAEPVLATRGVDRLLARLRSVNEELWEIEDAIRECEAEGEFGDDFIALARAVYITNDERARIKRELNDRLGSGLIEEKGYAAYGAPSFVPALGTARASTTPNPLL